MGALGCTGIGFLRHWFSAVCCLHNILLSYTNEVGPTSASPWARRIARRLDGCDSVTKIFGCALCTHVSRKHWIHALYHPSYFIFQLRPRCKTSPIHVDHGTTTCATKTPRKIC